MKHPKILIVYKKTFYELCLAGRKVTSSLKFQLSADQMARFKKMHDEHTKTLKEVENTLQGLKVPYVKHYRNPNIKYSQFDLIITVGGDGTVLQAARFVDQQMILGVNSDPKRSVGKFCVATRQNFSSIIRSVLSKHLKPISVKRLKLTSSVNKTSYSILNDALICDSNPAAVSRYVLSIGNLKEYQRSSGLWISTAAGSSGATKSAGGRALAIKSSVFQYRPRELYYKRKKEFQLTGGILQPCQTICVRSNMLHGVIFLDGAHFKIPFTFGQKIAISLSDKPLRLIYR